MCLFSARCVVPFLCDHPSVDCDMEAPAISFTQLVAGFRLSYTSVYDPLLPPFSCSLSSISPSPLPLLPSGHSLRLSRCLPNTSTASSFCPSLSSLSHMHVFVRAHLSRKWFPTTGMAAVWDMRPLSGAREGEKQGLWILSTEYCQSSIHLLF